MKFTIDMNLLKKGIADVEKALSKNTSIPILHGIHVLCTNEEVVLTTSDTNTSIQVYMPVDGEKVKVNQVGAVVWNKKVTEIVKKLPGNEVTFELADSLQTVIKAGSVEFQISGMDAEEFPKLPSIGDKAPTLHIEGKLLQNMVRKTSFAAATTETRPILQAVFVEILKKGMVFTATDSHRLSRVFEKGLTGVEEAKYPVPAKALDTAIKKIFEPSQGVEVYVQGDSQLILKSDNVVFYTRLLEGNYPDTSRLIPSEYMSKLVVNRDKLYKAIDLMNVLKESSNSNKSNIKLEVSSESEGMKVSLNQKEVGKGFDVIKYSEFEGEPVVISFDPKYMMDALTALDSEEVMITFNGPMRPFLVIPKQNAENVSVEELQLILPIRTY